MSRLQVAYVPLLLLLMFQFVVQATNSVNALAREEPPSSCVDGCSKRTLFSIIWGCLSTTIICAWAAIHPNIPPNEGPFKGALRRLELMFWTIICPEILPCWALNQRFSAITVRDEYNKAKGYEPERFGIWKTLKGWFSLYEITDAVNPAWTLKHGHFLIMGGIHLVEPAEPEGTSTSSEAPTGTEQNVTNVVNNEPRGTSVKADTEKGEGPSEIKPKTKGRVTILTLEMLRVLIQDPEFEIEVTEAEIMRTSKGDGLSKAIFILQSSWFIVQCIARHVQGLDLTQLELTTLALASLNGITFILWWDKPLGAQTIVRVYMKRKLTDAERNVEGRGNSKRSQFIDDFQKIATGFTWVRDIVLCRGQEGILLGWLVNLPMVILIFLLYPIIIPGMAFFCTIYDLIAGSRYFPVDATHVPAFYVPQHQHYKYIHILILLLFGTIFGGIHCAGWNLPFPTHQEQKLWRVASLGVTVIPVGAAPSIYIVDLFVALLCCLINHALVSVVPFIAPLPLIAYVCARLILLGQALSLLRYLPPSALAAVDWSQFYPHFL